MSKNLLGKSRPTDKPYAIFKGNSPFGDTTVHVLKTYQKPEKELSNQYARWQVAVKTDMTYGSFDIGDSYINDVIRGLKLVEADDLFKENYALHMQPMIKRTGWRIL
tara:strand:- start:300 stop:620 length:321 start_codon:yes stop_codon:yes gene_type:complete